MSGKQVLFDALRHRHTDQIPWVPFAGVHAGKLVGKDATEVLTNADALFEALLAVNRLYKPHGQPIAFDLQIEAEILGCELAWSKEGPPSVKTHPLADTMTVPCRCTLPRETDGRVPLVLEATRRMKEAVGADTALYGLVCGPFTLASHLRGNDLFMDLYDDEDYVRELLDYCTECAKMMSRYYAEAGADVIAVVDPLVSQISRDHFETFLTRPFTEYFEYLRELKVFSSFFVCGDVSRNVESMCQTKPDSISVDENVDLPAAKRITDRYGVTIGGNIPLTSVLLHGTQQDVMKCVLDLADELENKDNFILAPGCDMPYAVPVENGIAVSQAALHLEETRKMLRNYVAVEEDIQVELPDYAGLQKPLLECFTLDSATCAACGYMAGAAEAAKARLGDRIDYAEYKFTTKQNIARCKKLGVKNLPSLYLNGELIYSSLIPSPAELDRVLGVSVQAFSTAQ